MSVNTVETHHNDPLFHSAMSHLQSGEWRQGLEELDQLVENYPLAQELRKLRQEMQLRARIDQYEEEDEQLARRQKLMSWGVRIGALLAFLALAFWGLQTYSSWIDQQIASARNRLESQVQSVELAVKYRDAQDLIQAGRPAEAKILFQEVFEHDPEFGDSAAYIEQADKLIELDAQYSQAIQYINLGELGQALELLEAIQETDPYYKDVSIRITEIESQFFLAEILDQAERAYAEADWATAADKYETVRYLNPAYKPEYVEEQLFQSYMSAAIQSLSVDADSLEALGVAEEYFRKALVLRPQDPVIRTEREQARDSFKSRLITSYLSAAQTALTDQEDSLDALATADSYFQKALQLRPNDPEIQLQRQLAQSYLTSQEAFKQGLWDEVIVNLETVHQADPDYANGTARQTLYDAYIARGDLRSTSGEYDLALVDYQNAAVLAEEAPESKLRLYEAQLKVAEAQGLLGNYESAVLVYQAVIDIEGLGDVATENDSSLLAQLQQAAQYANWGNDRTAFRLYRELGRTVLTQYATVSHEVQSGEYLSQLANQYNTTVDAILRANQGLSPKQLTVGQEIVIPVLSAGEEG